MTSSLIVSNLPAVLTEEESKDLLSHFHANHVEVFKRGRKKKAIFARFGTVPEARHALLQLHQARLGRCRLVVEYADEDLQLNSLSRNETSQQESTSSASDRQSSCLQRLAAFPFPSPGLRYSYPPPSVSILARISAALVATPRLYTQVLHLMNKMSLPAPFPGPEEPSVPVPPGSVPLPAAARASPVPAGHSEATQTVPLSPSAQEELAGTRVATRTDVAVQTEAPVSSSESEMESSDEDKASGTGRAKRRRLAALPDTRRRLRAVRMLQKSAPAAAAAAVPSRPLSEVFDTPSAVAPARAPVLRLTTDQTRPTNGTVPENQPAVEVGFAKMYPSRGETAGDTPSAEETENTEFITDRQLAENRISQEDMKVLPVFGRYSAGEPSARLYIKNLDKRVVPADLRRIYGRYVNWQHEEETNAFDVRLMQEGRMKGQAFISLPSPSLAQRALADTNGYILRDKPMVVQFGRSARPRDTAS